MQVLISTTPANGYGALRQTAGLDGQPSAVFSAVGDGGGGAMFPREGCQILGCRDLVGQNLDVVVAMNQAVSSGGRGTTIRRNDLPPP